MSSDTHERVGEHDRHGHGQLDGTVAATGPGKTSARQHVDPKSNDLGEDKLEGNDKAGKSLQQRTKWSGLTSWFAIPAPLRRLFDKFPLETYDPNALPMRAILRKTEKVLCIFTSQQDAIQGRPSFNPSCLKWQTYLKTRGISFITTSSNNHASPSGSLPFLLVPAQHIEATTGRPISTSDEVIAASRLKKWAQSRASQCGTSEPNDLRYDAYASLLENAIRKAWLYQLYLHPANEASAKRLYVEPCSSNPFVQLTIGSQLKAAAEGEVIKASGRSGSGFRIDEVEIMHDAQEAFEALSTLLSDDLWFFYASTADDGAGLFDASVFAYTHLILDERLEWGYNPLANTLRRFENLVKHRARVLDMYY